MSADGSGTFAFDRERLRTMAIDLNAEQPAWMQKIGPGIAEVLRQQLPGLNEVVIGQVLLALTTGCGRVPTPVAAQQEPPGKQAARGIWSGLFAAGLHLSRSEWKQRR